MRSSKSRSRSKQNRPRNLGNVINRVFDSSGPEGKVRGTPQQVIEKYQLLARDAQLSNDRIAAENFLQHAEHYARLLAEAQRELAAEQEARQAQYNNNNNGQNGAAAAPSNGQNNGQNNGQQPQRHTGRPPRQNDNSDKADHLFGPEGKEDYDASSQDEQPSAPGLDATNAPAFLIAEPPQRHRPKNGKAPSEGDSGASNADTEAAAPKPKPARGPRTVRKIRPDETQPSLEVD